MKQLLLDNLFKVIGGMRKLEIDLLKNNQHVDAAIIREANEALSDIRNKLITAQLREATGKLNEAIAQLETISINLQTYLDATEASDKKLLAVLENLPSAVALIDLLTG